MIENWLVDEEEEAREERRRERDRQERLLDYRIKCWACAALGAVVAYCLVGSTLGFLAYWAQNQ